MWYVNPNKNRSGAYAPPQSIPFPGAIPMEDTQWQDFIRCQGFVHFTQSDGKTLMTTDEAARDRWLAECAAEAEKEGGGE